MIQRFRMIISANICIIVLLFWSSSINAGSISGVKTYQDGEETKQVDLSGLEWMRLDTADTGQLNRAEMEKAFKDKNSMFYGWRYATREETARLLRSLGTEHDGWSEKNLAGITWFFDHFGTGQKEYPEDRYMKNFTGWDFAYGEKNACRIKTSLNNYGCRGIVGLERFKSGLMYKRWGSDPINEEADSIMDTSEKFSDQRENVSHLLVRDILK